MRLMTNDELFAVAGGLEEGMGLAGEGDLGDDTSYFLGSGDGGGIDFATKTPSDKREDQRNQQQKEADAALKKAQEACKFLQFGCADQAAAVSFYSQSQAYNICIAEGGKPGPNDCGKRPTYNK